MLEAIRRHPVVTFFILAFPLSWYPWIIALARGKTTGPNPLGPLVAGLIVSAVVYGRRGLLDFLRRLVLAIPTLFASSSPFASRVRLTACA